MHEGGKQFNEYKRSIERPSWQDIPAYAKEILLAQGTERHQANRSMVDYSWSDSLNDDLITIRATGFHETASYCIEVNDGTKIDHIRRYAFWFHQPGIAVYDRDGQRLESEEGNQIELQTYLHQRLSTSQQPPVELSDHGTHVFWQLAADIAIDNNETEAAIRSSLNAPSELGGAYHDYLVETTGQTAGVPERYVSEAILKRRAQIQATRQLGQA